VKGCDSNQSAALCPNGAGSSNLPGYGMIYCCATDNCNSASTFSSNFSFIAVSAALLFLINFFGNKR
jgi:hypothetical protein